jgi:hypothetical protein
MAYPNLSYVDGIIAAVSMSAYCYNNATTFTAFSGDPSEGAVQTDLRNSDQQLIGTITFIDGRRGSIQLQYDLLEDEAPGATKLVRPTYIFSFRGRYFVAGAVPTPVVKNEVIKFSPALTELQNPFVPILLTALGQQKAVTTAVGSLPITVACAASNLRTNSTVVYSLEDFDTPGAAAPTGYTINSSSGLMTIANTAAVGVHDIRVIVSDTVTPAGEPSNTIKGFGRYTHTVTA